MKVFSFVLGLSWTSFPGSGQDRHLLAEQDDLKLLRLPEARPQYD